MSSSRRQIWKFPVPVTGQDVEIEIPDGADVVHVAGQGQTPMLWIDIYDIDNPNKDVRTYRAFRTGHDIPEVDGGGYWWHVGTAVCGQYVWHIYEKEIQP